jgi:hypothetical protein
MTGIYALRTTWIIKKAPLESYDVSTSPSAHPSSFSTLHTQVSPFPLKIQRDGGIPYRSGWVKRFKQSTESHSYLPPRDSASVLLSSLLEKNVSSNVINSTWQSAPNKTMPHYRAMAMDIKIYPAITMSISHLLPLRWN